ncbi:MAG TPA: SRPBCC domain-containing protein [Kofleriaceae bacterium]|nr:SRPBCC domain-containing protein [Kofleriaceae bacterium]
MTGRGKAAARAIADIGEGVVLARIEIAAPPERVFRALTTDELTTWWGSAELYRTTKLTIDLRPGGAWRTEGVGSDGSAFHVAGEVLELDPPRRLVQTWQPSWEDGPPTMIAYSLDPIEGGTRVTLRHTGFAGRAASCEDHAQGWERVLGWLGGHLAAPAQPRYFMCRLLPPRPSFMQDMTADERAIMQAHASYWRDQLAAGVAIAFGPVVDPSGGWGLGILAVHDEAALQAFQAGDPAIQAGRGFRYEALPMARVVH